MTTIEILKFARRVNEQLFTHEILMRTSIAITVFAIAVFAITAIAFSLELLRGFIFQLQGVRVSCDVKGTLIFVFGTQEMRFRTGYGAQSFLNRAGNVFQD